MEPIQSFGLALLVRQHCILSDETATVRQSQARARVRLPAAGDRRCRLPRHHHQYQLRISQGQSAPVRVNQALAAPDRSASKPQGRVASRPQGQEGEKLVLEKRQAVTIELTMKFISFSRTRMSVPLTLAVAVIVLLSAGAHPLGQAPETQSTDQQPVFRSGVTLVTTDVIVRDGDGQFLPELTLDDFVVYEDGQRQEIVSLVLVHGGRVYNQLLPAAPAPEGIVLPTARPTNDTPGRVFVLFIDDLHMSVSDTPKIQRVLEQIYETLIHEGDLYGVISSGRSAIRVPMTYERDQLLDVIPRVVGEGLRVQDLVTAIQANSMELENRWRATVAFKTARSTVDNLEEVHNRRKVFLYVSTGYDFDPFEEARVLAELRSMERSGLFEGTDIDLPDLNDPNLARFGETISTGNTFSDAELRHEILLLTGAANRANVSFYTIDPRGLGSMPDLDYDIRVSEWNDYLRTQHSSLRQLAELTGGIAVVNRNTFEEAFQQIDAETSDYYILGFYSSNPDPSHPVRELRVEVNHEDAEVRARTHYILSSQ